MLAKSIALGCVASLVSMLAACSAAPPDDASTGSTSENMSTAIHTTYGLTTFGGPGDYQQLACTGASSKYDQQWYVASSQRYGCSAHLKIMNGAGKCVVARTDDAGPASFVESRAGIAVLDSSPAVTAYLFGNVGGLGWSDLADHPGRYDVTVTKTTLPLGPCDSGTDDSSGDDDGSGSSSSADSSGSSGSSGGATCSGDGDCNPGNDGSGMICSSHQCVPGCHSSAQCPGNTTCQSGQCE